MSSSSTRVRLLLLAAGGAVVVWTLVDPRLRGPEGWPRGSVVVGIALGAGLWLAALGMSRPWRGFAGWSAVALGGQAISLQLVRCGNQVGYQHLPSLQRLVADSDSAWFALLGLQAVAAGWFSWRRRATIGGLLRSAAPRRAWVATVALLALCAATVSPSAADYLGELALAALLVGVHLATLLVALSFAPRRELAELGAGLLTRDPPAISRRAGRWPRPVWAAAVGVAALAAALNLFVYQRHPHVPDEVAYVTHARLLAAGVLTLPVPPVPAAFETYLFHVDGNRWYPSPPPGWPAVLALGSALGAPWLVNPLLAGVSVLLAYRLLAELYDRRTARLATLLLALSPWHLFLGMSFMTHSSTLAFGLASALALERGRRTGTIAWSGLGGALAGAIGAIRPLDGLIVALVAGAMALRASGGGWRRLRSLLAFGSGCALAGLLLLAYNRHLTGHPFRFPLDEYLDQRFAPGANAYGFGPDRGMGWPLDPNPGHTVFDALVNSNLNAFAVNVELFGWSVGSLAFAGLLLFSARLRAADLGMLAVMALVYVAHFFYYFSGGPDFGARYWYLMILPLAALTARGILELTDRSSSMPAAEGVEPRFLAGAGVLCIAALTTFVPWRAIDKYHHYRGMRPDVRALAERHGFGRGLVLVRGVGHPDYASAAVYNPLDLRADGPVYAWDRGPEVRAELLAHYGDRLVWTIDGPTLTGEGYRVTGGPEGAGARLADPTAAPSSPTETRR